MSTTTIATAAREYASRPADERFPSVNALVTAAAREKELSVERTYNFKDLSVTAVANPTGTDDSAIDQQFRGTLQLLSPKGAARFTHWSFGQLCRSLGAPASYLRDLPPAIAADALNFGLKDSAPGTAANLLVKVNGGTPIVRACTSDSYGRVWDSELYGSLTKQILDVDDRWQTPPTWSGEPAGAYRGDRDSFVVVVNGGSIVNDPSLRSEGGDSTMYRGMLLRNSEVGASSVVIEHILFRYICGNHMLWGATMDRRFRRRHIGAHALRDTIREIVSSSKAFTNQSTARDNAIIKALIDNEIAHTKEAVIDELRAVGFTKDGAEAAYLACEQKETVSPRSFWGIANGATRVSQQSDNQDDRYLLDQLAAKVIARGAALVKV